ncbi:MAG: hypothetical protein C4342_04535, partial [Armatimonadota bacterium]
PERTARLGYTADTVRKKFTGYERDNESDLDFAQARYYKPSHGRFTSPDPYNIVFEKEKGNGEVDKARIFIAYISDPQIWNKYSYVVNNPFKYTDPDGRRPQTEQEKKDLERLRREAKNTKDESLRKAINNAIAGIERAIAASQDKKSDPRGLRIALWAINRLGVERFGLQGIVSLSSNGQSLTIGQGQWKCNIFVAAAQVLGGGVPLGNNGVPTTWSIRRVGIITGEVNIPDANKWASMNPNAVANYELVVSPQMGDIVAWANRDGLGHSAIALGSDLVIYASQANVKVNTIQSVSLDKQTDAVFRRKKE